MHWEQPARVASDLARFARSLPDPTMASAPAAADAPAPV
jgi:hypothetical protein